MVRQLRSKWLVALAIGLLTPLATNAAWDIDSPTGAAMEDMVVSYACNGDGEAGGDGLVIQFKKSSAGVFEAWGYTQMSSAEYLNVIWISYGANPVRWNTTAYPGDNLGTFPAGGTWYKVKLYVDDVEQDQALFQIVDM